MTANSQFDRFLHEKFLANEAAKREYFEKSNRIRNASKSSKDKNYATKNSMRSISPNNVTVHKASNESIGLNQTKA